MDDIASAVAAAAAAAAAGATAQPATQPAPPSPLVKEEIKRESSPAEPVQKTSMPPSPLKRPRSPAHDEVGQRDEKRLKTEDEANFDELARMIEQAQESANTQITQQSQMNQSDGQVSEQTAASGAGDQFTDDIVNGIMASLGSTADNVLSLSGGGDIRMDGVMDSFVTQDSALKTSAKRTLWNDPVRYTRRAHALPALRKAAVDVLKALSDNPFEDTWATLNDQPESDISKEYATLKAFFDILRKYLSTSFPLLYADSLDISSPVEREIVRVANLATACASMFGTNEITLEDLNRDFLSIFIPRDQNMPSDVAELYLGLKTQMFLILLESEPQNREQVLEELFVSGLEDTLKRHHPSLPLTVNESSFLENAKARKAMLLNESNGPDNIQALYQQFRYEPYLDSLGTYLNDNMAAIEVAGAIEVSSPTVADNAVLSSNLDTDFDLGAIIAEASKAAQDAVHDGAEYTASSKQASAYPSGNIPAIPQQAQTPATNNAHQQDLASAAESASRFSQLAIQSIQQNQYRPPATSQASSQPVHTQGPPIYPAQQQQANTQQQYYRYPQQPPPSNMQQQNYQTPSNENLPPNQSETTSVLYERARQAAAARSSTHARREGSHSTRRPWAPEEERALMMGLDMVKGPHWSQILSLFGPNGTISNILADRTQVQLKDKARNLKLFFLKTNSEMPYYLQCVTGELKTRAPSQAARKEAEERARMNSEEEQARINGIMTLGNMQQNGVAQGSRPNGPMTSVPNGTPGQQMPHAHPGPQQGTPGVSYAQAGQPAHTPASSAVSSVQNTQSMHLPPSISRPQAVQGQPPGQPQVQAQIQQHSQSPSQIQMPNQPQSQAQSLPQAHGQGQPQPQVQIQHPQQSPQTQPQPQRQQQQYQQTQQQQTQQVRSQNPPQYPQQGQRAPEGAAKKEEPNVFQDLNPEETALLEIKKALEREKAEQAQAQAQLAANETGAVVSTSQS